MSTPKRFFIENLTDDETEVYLDGEEFTHAKTVLRVEEGAEIVLLDGTGKEYSAIVAKSKTPFVGAYYGGKCWRARAENSDLSSLRSPERRQNRAYRTESD